MQPEFNTLVVDDNLLDDIYNIFFNETGYIILKNIFTEEIMDEYNKWCKEHFVEILNTHKNTSHPKQKDKIVINNLLEIMSKDNPELLLKIINNNKLNKIIDKLLGLGCFGSLSCHCIKPKGERQTSHVDYPLHVGSGKFWENNETLIDRYITNYQLNHILPFFSVQCLIASDAMNKNNGSTEVVPGSHLIENVDKKILEPSFYNSMENEFRNVSLEKGDVLLFNRGLLHRGGHNKSDNDRNSLIIQYVWLFGIGQHNNDKTKIINNLLKTKEYNNLSTEEKKILNYRIKQPYPINTTEHN